jgi:hypothetical protein
MIELNNELKRDYNDNTNLITHENSKENTPIESKIINHRIEKYLNHMQKSINLIDVNYFVIT